MAKKTNPKTASKRTKAKPAAAGKGGSSRMYTVHAKGRPAKEPEAPSTVRFGSVYVVSEKGISKRKRHVAPKATAEQIRESIGIPKKTRDNVRAMLERLENEGLLKKI